MTARLQAIKTSISTKISSVTTSLSSGATNASNKIRSGALGVLNSVSSAKSYVVSSLTISKENKEKIKALPKKKLWILLKRINRLYFLVYPFYLLIIWHL